MTEHEKLKEICDMIGYDILLCGSSFGGYTKEQNKKLYRHTYYNTTYNEFHRDICGDKSIECNIREIIFAPEFMEKIYSYFYSLEGDDNMRGIIKDGLMASLDKPVDYLYNLIKE